MTEQQIISLNFCIDTIHASGKPVVANLNSAIIVEQDISRLQVTMYDFALVHVL
jgi:hypothetical protein